MKSKQEIYNNTVELIEKQEKENYLVYYKVFLDNSGRHDISTEEIEKIISEAYETYKKQ
jgi:dimeric dUTPase (all-alpha-NTP-PPase superfamily)